MRTQCALYFIAIIFLTTSGCKKDGGAPAGPGPTPGGIAEVEPNDNTPQDLGTLGTSDVTVNGSTANSNDVDIYAITLGTGGNLYASVSWSSGSDLDLGVMNPSGVMINFQDTGGNPEKCTLPSMATGTYRIQVTSKTATATSYTLTIGRR